MNDHPQTWNLFEKQESDLGSGSAGSSFSIPITNNQIIEPIIIQFDLATSTTVATRTVFIELQGFSFTTKLSISPYNQAANTTNTYIFSTNQANYGNSNVATYQIPLPTRLKIYHGESIIINVHNMDASDVIQNVKFIYNRWMELN